MSNTKIFENHVIDITNSDHRNKIVSENKIVVIDYYTEWCGPCKEIKDEYNQLAKKYNIENVCILVKEDAEKTDMESLDEVIKSVPTFHFYVDGKLQKTLTIKGANISRVSATIDILIE